jgi:hypothetical protein
MVIYDALYAWSIIYIITDIILITYNSNWAGVRAIYHVLTHAALLSIDVGIPKKGLTGLYRSTIGIENR